MIFNAHSRPVDFTLPEVAKKKEWTCVLDTSQPQPHKDFDIQGTYKVPKKSTLVFVLRS